MAGIFNKAYKGFKTAVKGTALAALPATAAYTTVDKYGLPNTPRHKLFMPSIFDFHKDRKASMTPQEYQKAFDTMAQGDNTIERMNSMRGKVTMQSTDGSNCIRAISTAMHPDDPRYNYLGKGQTIDIYDAIRKAKEHGSWVPLEHGSDLSKVPDNSILISTAGEHATLTAPHNGLIQSGSSRNGIYYAPTRDLDYTGGIVDGYISGDQ